MSFPEPLSTTIRRAGMIAVLVVDDSRDAVPLAEALFQGGIRVIELTLRTPAAWEALAAIRRDVPQIVAGVGTVLTEDQVAAATDHGAAFAVAPGCSPSVLQAAARRQLPFAPGICTPTDIELAVSFGCRLLKFFPAEPSGGLRWLKAIGGPYQHLNLEFMPLGGINEQHLAAYLAEPCIHSIGGSWIAPRQRIASRDFGAVTEAAADAMRIVRQFRKETD